MTKGFLVIFDFSVKTIFFDIIEIDQTRLWRFIRRLTVCMKLLWWILPCNFVNEWTRRTVEMGFRTTKFFYVVRKNAVRPSATKHASRFLGVMSIWISLTCGCAWWNAITTFLFAKKRIVSAFSRVFATRVQELRSRCYLCASKNITWLDLRFLGELIHLDCRK